MIITSSKLETNALSFARFLYKKTLTKAKIFQFLFWLFSLFSIFFAFFSTLMGIFKLASPKLETLKTFANLFLYIDDKGNKVDQWPIFILWINLSISLVNALFALFLIKNRWLRNQEINDFLKLELIMYENRLGKYKNCKNLEMELFNAIFLKISPPKGLSNVYQSEKSQKNYE